MKGKNILLSIVATCLVSGYAQAQSSGGKKILVAYYSHSGNTEAVAKHIHNIVGGDIFMIEPLTAYSTDYDTCVEQAKKEIEAGYKPALKAKVDDIASYDIIFVGTPNWWSTIAPPVATFLSDYDLSGKTIVPFCTHGGGREARCFTDMAKLCPQSTTADGFVVSGNSAKSSENEVNKWLKRIKIVE